MTLTECLSGKQLQHSANSSVQPRNKLKHLIRANANRITEAEIELTVVAENAAGGEAEIGWWVFKAKAQESIKEANTHKVRIKLDVGKIEVE
jgi:Trypsin-co-occurring domain 2